MFRRKRNKEIAYYSFGAEHFFWGADLMTNMCRGSYERGNLNISFPVEISNNNIKGLVGQFVLRNANGNGSLDLFFGLDDDKAGYFKAQGRHGLRSAGGFHQREEPIFEYTPSNGFYKIEKSDSLEEGIQKMVKIGKEIKNGNFGLCLESVRENRLPSMPVYRIISLHIGKKQLI